MFKKPAIKLSFIKDDENDTTFVDALPKFTTEDITRTAKTVIKYVAVGVVATAGAIIAMDTASQVTVNRLSNTSSKEEN